MSDHPGRLATSSAPVHADAPQPPGLDPRRWWSLALLAPAQFMVILDVTVVNAALPSIGADLRLDRASLTWVVTAHTLSFGGLLLGGRLLPLHRRRGRADPVDEVAAGARLHA